MKIWRNRYHNRLWVLAGGRLFVRIPAFARDLLPANFPAEHVSGGGVRVYRAPSSLPFRVASNGAWGATAPHHGLFGNSVAGLIPKVAAAVENRFGKVLVLGASPFTDEDLFGASGEHNLAPNMTISIHENPKDASAAELIGLVHIVRNFAVTPESSEAAWSYLASALLSGWNIKATPRDVAVVHLRGGDVYYGTRNLPNHGQPPVSFYTAVIRALAIKKVLIVHQGDIPLLPTLVSSVENLGASVETSSQNLRSDLENLLGATTLIAGRGSFAPAVAGLSRHLERVFFFESGFDFASPKPSVEVYRVEDAPPKNYVKQILSCNWARSKKQLALMVDYSEQSISLPASAR